MHISVYSLLHLSDRRQNKAKRKQKSMKTEKNKFSTQEKSFYKEVTAITIVICRTKFFNFIGKIYIQRSSKISNHFSLL